MKSLVLFLLGLIPVFALAQTSTLSAPSVEEDFRQRVLVVGFHSGKSYFSDCDLAIAGESKIRKVEVRDEFQDALEDAIIRRVGQNYATIGLSQKMDGRDGAFFKRYYHNIGFGYEVPTRLSGDDGEVKWGKKLRDRLSNIRLGQKKKEKGEKSMGPKEKEAFSYISTPEEQYLAAHWPANSFLYDLVKTYHADYILTINQFEVKTDYRKCVDRELGNFTRKIRVHFNLFSPQGECLFGDVVTVNYNSTTEDVENIIGDNFDLLSDFISSPLSMPISGN